MDICIETPLACTEMSNVCYTVKSHSAAEDGQWLHISLYSQHTHKSITVLLYLFTFFVHFVEFNLNAVAFLYITTQKIEIFHWV